MNEVDRDADAPSTTTFRWHTIICNAFYRFCLCFAGCVNKNFSINNERDVQPERKTGNNEKTTIRKHTMQIQFKFNEKNCIRAK